MFKGFQGTRINVDNLNCLSHANYGCLRYLLGENRSSPCVLLTLVPLDFSNGRMPGITMAAYSQRCAKKMPKKRQNNAFRKMS